MLRRCGKRSKQAKFAATLSSSKQLFVVVNTVDQSLVIVGGAPWSMTRVDAHGEALIPLSILKSPLQVHLEGEGLSSPIKMISKVDSTRVVKILDEDIKFRIHLRHIVRFQVHFRMLRKQRQHAAASKIQALIRGALMRSIVTCKQCDSKLCRGLSVPISHTYDMEPNDAGLSHRHMFKVQAHFMHFNSAPTNRKALNSFGVWREFVCLGCFRAHVDHYLMKENRIGVPCFGNCQATIPESAIRDFSARSTLERLELLKEKKEFLAVQLQAWFRGAKQRAPRDCPICLDTVPSAMMNTFFHHDHSHLERHDVVKCECCLGCLQKMLQLGIDEGRLFFRCFGPCNGIIENNEVERHVGKMHLAKLQQNRTKVQGAYVTELQLGFGDPLFAEWCSKNTRICPGCSAIIYRYAGCDSMQCKCGQPFNWSSAGRVDTSAYDKPGLFEFLRKKDSAHDPQDNSEKNDHMQRLATQKRRHRFWLFMICK